MTSGTKTDAATGVRCENLGSDKYSGVHTGGATNRLRNAAGANSSPETLGKWVSTPVTGTCAGSKEMGVVMLRSDNKKAAAVQCWGGFC